MTNEDVERAVEIARTNHEWRRINKIEEDIEKRHHQGKGYSDLSAKRKRLIKEIRK